MGTHWGAQADDDVANDFTLDGPPQWALVHFADGGRGDPSPELLCDGPLKADRFRASSRQHPVQDRRSDGSLGLLGSEAVGSYPRSDQRLVTAHRRFN